MIEKQFLGRMPIHTDLWRQCFATSTSGPLYEERKSGVIVGDDALHVFAKHIPIQLIAGKRPPHIECSEVAYQVSNCKHVVKI